MNKAQVGSWVWVLIYGGLLTACVAVFVLRATAEGASASLGWGMLIAGAVATAAGAALVVVRARMEEPVTNKKADRQ